jgi:hypothetical protein
MMSKTIKVLCVTPNGVNGRGGIDRLYRSLREFHRSNGAGDISLTYFAARGNAPGLLWILTFPWRALCFSILLLLRRPDIVHINFATGGSLFRKYVLLRLAKRFGAKTVVHFHGQFTADDVSFRMTANKSASLYLMVMTDHTCPFGLKARDLLEREGFDADDTISPRRRRQRSSRPSTTSRRRRRSSSKVSGSGDMTGSERIREACQQSGVDQLSTCGRSVRHGSADGVGGKLGSFRHASHSARRRMVHRFQQVHTRHPEVVRPRTLLEHVPWLRPLIATYRAIRLCLSLCGGAGGYSDDRGCADIASRARRLYIGLDTLVASNGTKILLI